MGKSNSKYGAKIRELKIDQKQYGCSLFVMLLLFYALLIVSLSVLNKALGNTFIVIFTALVFVACTYWCIRTFIHELKVNRVVIYERGIVIKNVWTDKEIDISQIYGAEPKKLLIGKIFKTKTSKICLNLKSFSQNKVVIRFVQDEPTNVCNLIMELAVKARKEEMKLKLRQENKPENKKDKSTK